MSDEQDRKPAGGAEGIAVVGMAGRFPGARDLGELWRMLCQGVEAVSFYSREELAAAGVDPALIDDPRYVRASARLAEIDRFDAPFFGFGPRDAELMDPQHRLFLECCWEALETGGYDSETYRGTIGVFGGMGMSGYLLHNLLSHPQLLAQVGPLQVRILNDVNYLASLTAFKLNLTGPSMTVQTACSTSLVATCLACQALLNYQCDAALAGGTMVAVPHGVGYVVQGGVTSTDGHCRAFDADADGSVEGNGTGVVLLKRLADAIADGDTIHAVIKGFATNNDGSFKASFTAPSADGQMEAIAMAQALAGVDPATITYVETHGTGTPLGDPIEVAALTEVFAASTDRKGFCAIGSIKTNIGHLDAAAGIAGLIKTVLAVEHGVLPPSLNFKTPNPQIDFAGSPFYVNTETRPWVTPPGQPRRAGVSAFALGGVNAHVIVEEAPETEPGDPAAPWQLLVLSARTETALEAVTDRLAGHLRDGSGMSAEGLADVAFTLQAGRRGLEHRRTLVCRSREDAIEALEGRDPRRLLSGQSEPREGLAFLFPGLGNHYAGMARGLYEQEPAFRERLDECAEGLLEWLGEDIRDALFPGEAGTWTGGLDLRAMLGRSAAPESSEADRRLARTALSQPALFAVEYALARLLMDWGLRPQAMVGFSLGEYTAACLAGVFSLADALKLVAGRARLIDGLPEGAMLAVPLTEAEVRAFLGEELSVAALAGPLLTVVAGPAPAVAAVEERLTGLGHVCRRLQTTHAFHSRMMEPVVPRFLELFRGLELRAPEIPYLSNVTGTWITPEQATDPRYWADHLLKTVRFADAVEELWREPGRVLIEAGPGQTLSSWALQHPAASDATDPLALPGLRHSFDRQDDRAFLLGTLGRLWLAGVRIDWEEVWAGQRRRRVPLPTYPFERQRYWIEPAGRMPQALAIAFPGSATEPHEAAAAPAAARRIGGVHSRPNLRTAYVEPRNDAERRLAALVADLLHLREVGVHDDFFDLGGDSLLATNLVSRIHDAFGVELPLQAVFEAPTPGELAFAVVEGQAAGTGRARVRIERRDARDEAEPPLSFSQQRLWVLNQLEPGNPFYNVAAASELRGPLRPAVLAASFSEIARRHETLRTTFHARDGRPYQRIAQPVPAGAEASWPLPWIDLAALPAGRRSAEVERLAVEEARLPFDLERGPLVRTTLVRTEAGVHILFLSLHHIISDGWSNAVFTREMLLLYEAFAEGRPSPLAGLPIQYADFATWQARWLTGERLEEPLRYWRERLAGSPPALDLPADRPRPPVESHRGARLPFAVPRAETEALARLGREEGATLFMVLLAAFGTLLSRYTGQRDVPVGTPVANRRRSEVEGLIGFFANTLVLRLDFEGGSAPPFRELLRRARDVAQEAYAYQDVPFERLVEELQPQRDLSRSPLFQVMLVLQSNPIPPDLDGSRSVRLLDLDPGIARFDLLLDLAEGSEGLYGAVEYATDLFDRETVRRIEGHLSTLLRGILADPDAPVSELPLLTGMESRQILVEWNRVSPEEPGRLCVHRQVAARAEEMPEALAVVGTGPGSLSLTYRELAGRAAGLARHLRRLGVGAGAEDRVALALERSPEMAVALLAALEAGGACLPLDPAYPAERLEAMLADSGAAVLLVQAGEGRAVRPAVRALIDLHREAGGARVVDLDELGEEGEGAMDGPDPGVGLGNLAYVLYTSGSTGRPKGVAMSHGALANLAAWQTVSPPGARRTLQFGPLSFDVIFQEIFPTWVAGGALVLVSEEVRRDPAALLDLLRDERVERLFLPFVSLQQIAQRAQGLPESRLPADLREVITAGEQLQITPAVEAFFRRLPGTRLINHYGPTETHVATAYDLVGEPESWPRLPPIGRPVPGDRAHVVDRGGQPAPVGVPGELLVGGTGIARGYLGRPEATAERFVPDPFGPLQGEAGGRLYRTGDLARFLPDGDIEFLGRVDHQVKVRGFRIEPGEIEAQLASHPGVREAVVAVRGEGDGRRLVAYVVPHGTGEAERESLPEALREFLAERLPDYMIPSNVAVLDALPLTPSGKVDRRALPEPQAAARPSLPVPPRDPVEELLAGLWSEVLETGPVGIHDSFFELGGHSLLATRLVSRVQTVFGVELPLRALFEAPTVAALAPRVEALRLSGEGAQAPPIVRAPRSGAPLPLSFSQERLWFLERLAPGTAAYNIPGAVDLDGPLRPAALAAAFREVVRRHEALRTVFESGPEASEPRQRVLPVSAAETVELPWIDLAGLPEAEREARAGRLAIEHASRVFDLERGPLFALTLLRLGADRHRLLVSIHHAVSDGWSIGVLVRELSALYGAAGSATGLPELPVQYGDYAVWQRSWLAGEMLERLLAGWRSRLAGAPAALDLPTDRPHGPRQTFRGGGAFFRLRPETAAALGRLAREQGGTLFMALLAGFQTLLHRASGQDDVVVGTPVAGRTRPELEGLIGMFVNTLALRGDLSGDPAFIELLGRVREVALEAYSLQDLPFEKLVEELHPVRDLARPPIFQTMFMLQNTPAVPFAATGLMLTPRAVDSGAVKFELALSLTEEAAGGIEGWLEYNADLFDAGTADRIASRIATLLDGAAADPARRLSLLPLLPEDERRQVLVDWNDTGAVGEAECLHRLFEAQARRTPERIAVSTTEGDMTYAELAGRAGRLAWRLREAGVGPEVRVGVCLERSAELIVAVLGVLAAGGAYVPMDPAHPAERLSFLARDTRMPVIVARQATAEALGLEGVLVLEPEEAPGEEAGWFESGAVPDNLAYLIYTSGSTGIPKGVAITHRNASALLSWAEEAYSEAELTGVLASTSIGFDLSVFELFVPLTRGGRVILVQDALRLPDLPRAGEVTLLNTVPSVLAELLRLGRLPASVKTVNLAGEPLRSNLVEALYRAGTVERVLNLYGPSEDTTYSTFAELQRDAGGEPSIGRPVRGTRAYVVDRGLDPAGIGIPGELCLAGAGLARGYLDRPALTAERFIPDPWSAEPGGRLYRTGDLARLRPDGEIEFLGRIDHQVKVRGFRIEPGEVEAAFLSNPAVAEAAVVVAEGPAGDRELVAFLVRHPEAPEVEAAVLRRHLQVRLPSAMVPSAFVFLEALPLTPNRKVDRRALARMGWEPMRTVEIGAAPRGPIEETVAAVWSDLLGVERVGTGVRFFDLGGHSLLAVRLVSRLRTAFGVDLPVRSVFEAPTIAGLAAAVQTALADGRPALPPVLPAARDRALPLSFSQERLWFLDRLEPGTPLYNLPVALRLRGDLDPALLAACLTEIARRHEAVRTVFGEQGGAPVQTILPASPFPLPVEDLSGLPDPRGAALARIADEAQRSFNLADGPLWRALLVRVSEGEHLALLSMHHIVSDGWSLGLLVKEMAALYQAFAAGLPSPLPALGIQYADFAAWQRDWLQGEALERQLAFWRDRLAGAPPEIELPADRPRPAVASHRGAELPVRLPTALTAGLQALARRHGATPFMVLLAGFQALLARLSGQEDLTIGTPVAGRNRAELEDLIGFFVNTLVLRGDLSGDPSFLDALGRAREASLAAHAHADVPFEKVVEDLEPERSLARTPLFQVMLALQNTPGGVLDLPGLTLEPVGVPSGSAKFELTLALAEEAGGLAGSIEYAADRFDEVTVERLASFFLRLLEAAVEWPETRLSELPLLSAEEARQLPFAWNDAEPAVASGSIHGLFEHQADRDPAATALEQAGERLTYGELEARANRLAHRLRRLGVRPEEPVAISLEPSMDLITAGLAVWKAGGVYLPLDPAHPEARRAQLLRASGARVLVTRQALLGGLRPEVLVCPETEDLVSESAERLVSGVTGVTPGHLAYLLFTSGSTGEPKGVAVEHGPTAGHLLTVARDYEMTPADRVLLFASIAFDMSLEEITVTLAAGATLVLREGDLWPPAELSEQAARLGITFLTPTTAYWHQWVQEGAGEVPGLRLVLVGGEAMVPEAARLWHRSPSAHVRLLNGYGPTETIVTATLYPVPAEIPVTGSVPIGPTLAHRSGHVLDRWGNPQPGGVAGELLLGGALARGYLGRPDLTAERFVPDPFAGLAERPGARLYRTGDLVRRLPSGDLEFLGRIDHQVKVRGFRIELGEIEAALARHPRVRASAILTQGAADDRRLVAYVHAAGEAAGELSPQALRSFLGERLPAYMVPAAFVILPALPLTATGKIDRRSLAALAPAASPGSYAAPRNPVEEVLAALWAGVLGLDRIGIDDVFFEVGGHSLMAARVVSRIREALGVELPLRDLFEAPTVAGLALRVEAARQSGWGPEPQAAIPRVPRGLPLPLSFAQQRLWFLDRLEPESPLYNVPVALRLTGRLSVPALAGALSEIARRHEALRTVFAEVDGEPVQEIRPPVPVRLPVVDLSGLPEALREGLAFRGLATEEAARPFDLAHGPLWRAVLLRLGETDHAALLTVHHIVSDGWSMGVLVGETAALYAAFSEGRPSPLPELPVQYADFAAWQRSWLAEDRLAALLAAWRGRLAGAPAATDLPTDRPYGRAQSHRGGMVPFRLAGSTASALGALARREGATLFMALLAGFQSLLHRLGGQEDLVVGSPIAGRNRRELEDLIGFFVNTLALRGDLSGRPDFAEVLRRTRKVALDAYTLQDVPFEKVVEELQPARDLARPPVFQTLLALQNAPVGALELPGLAVEPVAVGNGTAKLELALSVSETEDGLAGTLEYSSDLFDRSTAVRLADRLALLISSAVAHPERPVGDLALLSGAERHQLAVEWNDTRLAPGSGRLVHERVTARAAQDPEAPAVVEGDLRLTYGELAARAMRLARRLRRLGAGPEVPVGIFLERSASLAVGLLGALESGSPYVPLDPAYPGERLGRMLEDAAVPVAVSERRLAGRLPAFGGRWVFLDDLGLFDAEIEPPPGAGGWSAKAANLAYVLFTSGSTGRPKGICVEHASLLRQVEGYLWTYPLGPADRVGLVASPAFDASVLELWPALCAGASLYVPSDEVRLSPHRLLEWTAEQSVTHCFLPTPLLDLLLSESLPETIERGSLRRIITGGDQLRRRPPAGFPAVVNHYGPAECTVWATASHVASEGAVPPPIGRPAPNVAVYLLDRDLQPVPGGVPGEICIGGSSVSRGYLGRPDLTAASFLPDAFAAEPGSRLYRSGDLGRLRMDGEIEFLGRLDLQVKVRGVRIETGEIEAVLEGHPAVAEAAVAVQQERLAAFVVLRAGAPEPADLRSWLRGQLPSAMVPAAVVPLTALPLTPNGKVDRQALAQIETRTGAAAGLTPPRGAVEETLAGFFTDLLGVEEVAAETDFFAFGGHSLLAARLTSRLRAALGVELPVRAVFESPTVSGLARAVEAALREAGGAAPVPPVVPAPRHEALPLSFAQERLWFLDQLEPGSPLYNLPVALRVTGALRPAVLAACLAEIARRHESLRTTFLAAEGPPVQVIHPAPESFDLALLDLAGLPEPWSAAADLAGEEARRPFDLAAGPLWRAALLRLGAEDHLALLTLHHTVSDGWSMGLLVREEAALYEAFAAGAPSPLPPLAIQYADFAVWQRGWLQGESLERELAFWRGQLAGAPPALDLPTDRPRPAVESHRGAGLSIQFPAVLTRSLQALARREGASLFMVLLAGFHAVLSRLSGQEDLTVGTPVAGRNRAELEGLIGLFVNTLVLRADLAGDPVFREAVGRARETSLAAHAHPDIPFEKLVDELAPERSLARSPLFQVMLSLQNTPWQALALPGLTFAPADAPTRTSKFDLSLALGEMGEGLAGSFEYNTDLFDAATVERWAGHLQTLLAAAVENPGRRLSDLPLLTEAELGQLLAWNVLETAPEPVLLHELFERQADRDPEAVALQLEGQTLTYGELEARSNQVAHRLRRLGVHPETAVGVALERSLDWIVSLLGIWKSGGAYLPLDPAYPEARRAFLVQDARARFLISRRPLLGNLSAPVLLCLEEEDLAGESTERPLPLNSPFHTAYLIYTSGSTGEPKGVAVEHGPAAAHAQTVAREYALTPADRNLQFAAASFDVSIEQIVSTLAAGATLVLRGDDLWNPADLSSRLASLGVTVANLPTAYWQQWTREGEVSAGSLRLVIAGGEAMAPETARLWGGRLPLLNAYGPTEAVMTATLYPVPLEPPPGPAVAIGRPMAYRTAHVLDRAFHPQPAGIPGELCLGGLLGRGYLNRPALTAERFIPDPFGTSARLYRTGDLARRLPSGDLEYLGRLDHQVKVRGFRIELGEIEAALAGHPDVRESAVVLRGQSLAAYVAGPIVDTASLRGFLGERLPDHMVPASFVKLRALPLTPAGKIDRRALPALEAPISGETYVAPATPAEEVVAAIWSEVLGVERVGSRDDFFALGGHSLLATQVSARLRRAFRIEVPLRQLFEAPTVAALASRIERAQGAGDAPAAPPIVPVPAEAREEGLPLSFAQQRLWFIAHLEPDSPAYNVPFAFRIDGALEPGVLLGSFAEISRRHDVLRTTFALRGALSGEPVQLVSSHSPLALPVVDLGGLPETLRGAESSRLATEQARRPFDLARGPVLRLQLQRLGDEAHVLAGAVHHIASDEWSSRILFREVGTLYRAFREGRPSPLPELPVQYSDYAVWQRRWLSGEVLGSQLAYWRERLSGEPAVLELPADRPRPAVQTVRGAWVAFRLPDEAADLLALARREGATAFMALFTGFQVLLRRLTGQEDISVGTPITGRNRIEVEELIGFFLNTLVIRVNAPGDPGFRDFLSQVRELALEAYAHQDVPFEKLVDELKPRRSLGHTPLFQALFVLVHQMPGAVDTAGLAMTPFMPDLGVSKFDLTLSLFAQEGGISGTIEYNVDLFDATTVRRFTEHFRNLLADAARHPDRPLSELPLLADGEAHQITCEWNDRPAGFRWDGGIHELFERQAAATPHRIAVEWDTGAWTYAELDGRAARLAGRLRGLGVGPEVCVGVCAERGPELAAALLAVLKAGGAYLPLDPSYPRERLAFMLADAGVRVILAQESAEATLAALPDLADSVRILRIDGPEETLEGGGTPLPASGATADNIAYVIYTSGSTGRPKGAALPHRTLANLIAWQIGAAPGADAAAPRTLQFTSPSFDVSLQELFATWCAGGTLVPVSEEVRRDPERLAHHLAEARIERLFLPYVALQQLAEAVANAGPELAARLALREIVTAGERLQVTPQIAALCELAPAFRGRGTLRNQYGPSETHVVTERALTNDPAGWPALPPIGRPIAETWTHVLGRRLRPVPIGVAGELALGGAGLARGYLGRPDLTAERFVPDGASSVPGGRLYRTGDLVRLLADGEIEFLGRIDQQVKVRGFRIEPGEVEVALVSHPRIQEAAVVVREEATGDRKLVAYLVVEGGEPIETAELRDYLRDRLPAYMIPAAFVALPGLPLTASGKVNRAALSTVAGDAGASPEVEYVAPQSGPEREIAAAMGELLGVERVGIEDNFFDLGVHSLMMVRAASLLSERLGRKVSVLELFRFPTVASLSRHLGEAEEAPSREQFEQRAEARRQSMGRRRDRRGRRPSGVLEEEAETEEPVGPVETAETVET